MAVAEKLTRIACRLLLVNGTTASGTIKTVNMSYPTISNSGYTAERTYAVYSLIRPCLSKTVYRIESVKTNKIEEE